MAPLRNRSTRTANEIDVLEGLPVRQWRYTETLVGPPPADTLPSALPKSRWPEHPMPRDAPLLPEHSQQLLRLARAGAVLKRPAEADEDDKENGGADHDDESKETSRGFTAKKWTLVPRNLEEPEVEYLAKRRKGLPALYGGAVATIPTAGPMRKTKVRRLDHNGVAHVYEVLAPEGQMIDGEIVEESETNPIVVEPAALPGTIVEGVGVVNAEGIVVSNDLLQPTPNRRKPPPPRRKKKSGPGRGHKKVLFKAEDGSTVDVQTPTRSTLGAVGGVVEGDGGTPLPAFTPGEGDTPMPDAQDDDEEEGSEEGEDGDDDEREDGEVLQSPLPEPPGAPEITPAVPVLPVDEKTKTEIPMSTLQTETNTQDPDVSITAPLISPIDGAPHTSFSDALASEVPSLALPAIPPAPTNAALTTLDDSLATTEVVIQQPHEEPLESEPSTSALPGLIEVPVVEPLDITMADAAMSSEAPIQSLPTALEHDMSTTSELPALEDQPSTTINDPVPTLSEAPITPVSASTEITRPEDSTSAPSMSIPGLNLYAEPAATTEAIDPSTAMSSLTAPPPPAEALSSSKEIPDIFGNLELELDRNSQNPSTQPTESLSLPPRPPSIEPIQDDETVQSPSREERRQSDET